jgi:PDZ domain
MRKSAFLSVVSGLIFVAVCRGADGPTMRGGLEDIRPRRFGIVVIEMAAIHANRESEKEQNKRGGHWGNGGSALGLPASLSTGVLVVDVLPDTPPRTSGLKPGDVILQWGGKPVNGVTDVLQQLAGVTKPTACDLLVMTPTASGAYGQRKQTVRFGPASEVKPPDGGSAALGGKSLNYVNDDSIDEVLKVPFASIVERCAATKLIATTRPDATSNDSPAVTAYRACQALGQYKWLASLLDRTASELSPRKARASGAEGLLRQATQAAETPGRVRFSKVDGYLPEVGRIGFVELYNATLVEVKDDRTCLICVEGIDLVLRGQDTRSMGVGSKMFLQDPLLIGNPEPYVDKAGKRRSIPVATVIDKQVLGESGR